MLPVYSKVITKDNVTSIFGKSKFARIANPTDESSIFKWFLEFSYDNKVIVAASCHSANAL